MRLCCDATACRCARDTTTLVVSPPPPAFLDWWPRNRRERRAYARAGEPPRMRWQPWTWAPVLGSPRQQAPAPRRLCAPPFAYRREARTAPGGSRE